MVMVASVELPAVAAVLAEEPPPVHGAALAEEPPPVHGAAALAAEMLVVGAILQCWWFRLLLCN